MVDVAVSTQLQQWAFEKPTLVRPERSDSSASSPDMYHNDSETLRIETAAVDTRSQDPDSKEALSLHERYLSSEEDLSPMEASSDSDLDDDDVVIHEVKKEYFHARRMSVSRFEKGKSCDLAVVVSFTTAGRPKMIDLANQGSPPLRQPSQRSQRSASLAQLPIAAISKLLQVEKASRLSLAASPILPSPSTTRSPSPAVSVQSRRPSPVPTVTSRKDSSLHSSDSSFTESSTRSSSPWAHEPITRSFTNNSALSSSPWTSSRRPVSAAVQPTRPSIHTMSTAPARSLFKHSAPLTPLSPEPHAFLSSDPFETASVTSASPIIKSSSPHKRLRSISQRLSLAKIAITPSTKKWDSRVNGRSANSPALPLTPYTPVTPQTAPPISSSTTNKLRRNSRIASRPSSSMGLPTPEMPPMPSSMSSMLNPMPRTSMKKLVARGANEREPMLELPPFPAAYDENDPAMSLKARRIRKRKSLMDLL